MLKLKQINKEYKTGELVQHALNNVSLNLRDNEFVAILGPSGSGKTTLLNIIGGLDRYDSGDLVINGISTKKYTDRDWDSYRNHTIGFVFQSYNLIPHQTVLGNVELALTISGVSKAERRRRAAAALEQVGLGNQLHKHPGEMSGGQMQRVAIARALVNNPDILLADEPTGALDSETSIQVMELLKEVAKDRLVVMVTHNPELAHQYATRIVQLKDGVIRSDTDPFEPDAAQLAPPVHKSMGRSSMSPLTSLSLSFNNLLTKKARTLLTAFAGSIGIIGIALIMRGCNNFCTYCIVPYTRGRERSRDVESILNEVADLVAKGYKEVTLLGQNVNSYRFEKPDGETITFPMLLRTVAEAAPGVRIRFTTSHPKDMSDETLQVIADMPNVCKHIHLPVQSGSSRILKLMNRKYDREWYMDRVAAIRRIIPDCGLSTDIFSGFHSETEEDHQLSLSLMEECGYDSAFMFKYSERPGTHASKHLPDDVPEEVKIRRLNEIIALQNRLSAEANARCVGKTYEVLVEGVSKRSRDQLFGRTEQNRVVVFDRGTHRVGDFVMVKVTESSSATLKGEEVAG